MSDEDSLSDLVAANMAEDDENEFVIDSSVLQEVNEGIVVTIFSEFLSRISCFKIHILLSDNALQAFASNLMPSTSV